MLTPIFHPNFDDASVCIGDFWAASEGLDDLVVRIGRMIAYQEYNTRSPLNGLAAKWAAEHANMLPVDGRIVSPPADGSMKSAALPDAAGLLMNQLENMVSTAQPSLDPWAEKIQVL